MATIKRSIDAKRVNASHHEGWDQALDKALDGLSRVRRGTYDVKVTFSATVRVRNPGQIQKYMVTLEEI